MSGIAKIGNLEEFIIAIRGQRVLLDSDVTRIHGVETRYLNKAVANNPKKFPVGYSIEFSKPEKNDLVEKFHQIDKLKHTIKKKNK